MSIWKQSRSKAPFWFIHLVSLTEKPGFYRLYRSLPQEGGPFDHTTPFKIEFKRPTARFDALYVVGSIPEPFTLQYVLLNP